MFFHFGYSQTTNIPDENFEQALIDLGIDSDGTVNGQVLTADIETLTELDFSEISIDTHITDLTGIEDFTALEILNLNYATIAIEESDEDFLSNNLNLKELHAQNGCGDCGGLFIESLDFSNLEDLEYVNLKHVDIQSLKLDNPNYDYENLVLDLYHEGYPRPAEPITNDDDTNWTNEVCIQVNDPNAASNNEAPYNTWTITVNDFVTTYSFSSICNLNTEDFENSNSISVYPNPVQRELNFENPRQINLDKVEVFNIKGQLVKTFSKVNNQINIESLDQGVYFVKVKSEDVSETFKILKH
ncbi:T9SS type A sorting domain-containing protein [Psychroflexus aestuariivivens]|uniref:T9SS type A sorting domain-containing protein n=1 Tax=Psychroflexus aestuariivivens TaxID=1795040 RepID=UPI000FD6E20A|nr:T9SS type A sorting domain-containing protein [Psychroflexus aestuariivivens]